VKLLIVTHYFESHRGGIEIVAGRLGREFARYGIDVAWLATDATPAPDFAAEPRLRASSLAASNLTERRAGLPYPMLTPASFLRIAREVGKADVVLIHDALYLTSVGAFLAARWSGKPIMVVQHIGAIPFKNRILRWTMEIANRLLTRPMLARSDQTVFISESTARQFNGLKYRVPPDVIFNGVDTGIFSPPAGGDEVAAARAQLGLPIACPVALFVGRFVEKKGLPVLERLAKARPDVVFAFAGWGAPGPDAWKAPNVRVFRDLSGSSLARLYRASDVLVLPSTGEGFPLVIQEALACGLQVICGEETASADPDAASVVTAVPIDPQDPDRTAALFEPALAACVAAGTAAGRAARAAFAISRYSWSHAATRYAEIMTRLHRSRTGSVAAQHLPAPVRSLQKRG
jgi:glycosyltransferase involved in cell wall biosynthesis